MGREQGTLQLRCEDGGGTARRVPDESDERRLRADVLGKRVMLGRIELQHPSNFAREFPTLREPEELL